MGKVCWFIGLIVYCCSLHAQTVEQKLANAVKILEADSQMRHAILGFEVMDAKTGEIVFERNAQIGLAPASTQKIFTSIAGFELLGKDYRYKTKLGYSGKIKNGLLEGSLYIVGSGDPSLGSWRYKSTVDSLVLQQWVRAIKKAGIKKIESVVTTNESAFSHQAIPDGWIWQDIGNYYGAGAYQLNWKENQYEIILRSGNRLNDTVQIVSPEDSESWLVNQLKTAAKGTGDNAYVYLPVTPDRNMLISGTIPVDEKRFPISAAMHDPPSELIVDFSMALFADSIDSWARCTPGRDISARGKLELNTLTYFHTYQSPTFDSLNYWFMRRSINLYGEAFVKTIAYEKNGFGETSGGVELVRNFWASKGIDKAAINIIDGSGLSPQNRVTADALVNALKFAKTRSWYSSFYESLPTYNSMKIKSGSIGGARAFAGYHTSAQGKEYIVAILVNNYAGSSGEMVRKMYRVLDELK